MLAAASVDAPRRPTNRHVAVIDPVRPTADQRGARPPPVQAIVPGPRSPGSDVRVLGVELCGADRRRARPGRRGAERRSAHADRGPRSRRRRRRYALYELHLSPHDEAKPQDLEDMIEAIAQHRARLPGRACPLRPAVRRARAAHRRRPLGRHGVVDLRCAASPRSVIALDAAISAAYPDVRLGHLLGEPPQPRPGGYGDARARDALPQGAQLRLPARGRRRRARLAAARGGSRTPRSRSARRRSSASSSPPPRRSSRSSRAAATAATRTGSCARSAGDCPRAA